MRCFLKNLFALAIGSLISLVLLEVFLRIYDPFHFRVKGDKITLRANYKIIRTNNITQKLDREIIHTKNKLGFRGPEKPENFENYLSIIAVGGSTTECFYLSDGKDWVSLVGDKLATCFNNVWVNNAGLDGHSTFGHQLLLNDYLLDLKPKTILFYIGINDLGWDESNRYDEALTPDESYSLADFLQRNLASANTIYNILRAARARKLALNHDIELDLKKEPVLLQTLQEQQKVIDDFGIKICSRYAQRVQRLIDSCKHHGIDPIFITQPILYGEGIDSITNVNLETLKVWDNANGQTFYRLLKLYNNLTKETARKNGCWIIDAAAQMPRSSRYFYDMMHYSNEGAAKLSEIIFNELQPYLSRKYPSFKKTTLQEPH